MTKFLVVLCNKCKQPSLAIERNKTRSCPYCGNLIKITRLNILSSTGDANTARDMILKLKAQTRRRDTTKL